MKLKIGLIIVLAATAAAIIFRVSRIPDPLPQEVVGVWHSDSPGYIDRFFELSDAIMVFGQGERRLEIQFITRVEAEKVKDGLSRYTIYHQDKYGFEQKTVFFFKQGDVNTIWFKNQDNVTWQKYTLS